jgi:hypothetical protein
VQRSGAPEEKQSFLSLRPSVSAPAGGSAEGIVSIAYTGVPSSPWATLTRAAKPAALIQCGDRTERLPRLGTLFRELSEAENKPEQTGTNKRQSPIFPAGEFYSAKMGIGKSCRNRY